MFFFFLCLVLPTIDALVAVQIHRQAFYDPSSSCSFIRNASWSQDASINSCIWECNNEIDCQTATFLQLERICSMFKERCQENSIRPFANHFSAVICHRKNHDPISACSSTSTAHPKYEDSTALPNIPTTTEIQAMTRLTHANDSISGICNTTAGGNSTPSVPGDSQCNFVSVEIPSNTIDNNVSTKYTSFGIGNISVKTNLSGCDTGFYITPLVGPTVLRAIQFSTANDAPERDPIAITLEGTNSTSLTIGHSWTLIYSGPTGLDTDPGRFNLSVAQTVSNNRIAYTSYRLLITSKRGTELAVQYSEAILLGYH